MRMMFSFLSFETRNWWQFELLMTCAVRCPRRVEWIVVALRRMRDRGQRVRAQWRRVRMLQPGCRLACLVETGALWAHCVLMGLLDVSYHLLTFDRGHLVEVVVQRFCCFQTMLEAFVHVPILVRVWLYRFTIKTIACHCPFAHIKASFNELHVLGAVEGLDNLPSVMWVKVLEL